MDFARLLSRWKIDLLFHRLKVPTYDTKPEMSANEITDALIQKMQLGTYKFILVNYANADMVGHTGNLEAAIKAMQTLDNCFGRVVAAALEK